MGREVKVRLRPVGEAEAGGEQAQFILHHPHLVANLLERGVARPQPAESSFLVCAFLRGGEFIRRHPPAWLFHFQIEMYRHPGFK